MNEAAHRVGDGVGIVGRNAADEAVRQSLRKVFIILHNGNMGSQRDVARTMSMARAIKCDSRSLPAQRSAMRRAWPMNA